MQSNEPLFFSFYKSTTIVCASVRDSTLNTWKFFPLNNHHQEAELSNFPNRLFAEFYRMTAEAYYIGQLYQTISGAALPSRVNTHTHTYTHTNTHTRARAHTHTHTHIHTHTHTHTYTHTHTHTHTTTTTTTTTKQTNKTKTTTRTTTTTVHHFDALG